MYPLTIGRPNIKLDDGCDQRPLANTHVSSPNESSTGKKNAQNPQESVGLGRFVRVHLPFPSSEKEAFIGRNLSASELLHKPFMLLRGRKQIMKTPAQSPEED